MKKTFSNFRTLAALLMAGAAFAACSSDDNIIENQQPATPGEQVYTLTINASKGDGTTRALDLDGTKLVASWANGDELTVVNQTKSYTALGGTLTASNASGNTATFSGALTGTIEAGDVLRLNYHAHNYFTEFPNQDGTLKGTNGAEKYDVANATVTVASVDEGNITTTGDASFKTWTAMLKLTLQDGSSNLLNPTSLTISVAGIDGDLLTFSPTAATYTANGDGVLYFALPNAENVAYMKMGATPSDIDAKKATLAAATVTFTAKVGDDTYTATKPGYKFTEGKYYAATLTMAPAAPAGNTIDLSTVTVATTAQDGDVLTGTLANNVQISIADGATVILNNVTINGTNDSNYEWAGITCLGDATIILSGTNTVKGFYGDYPGIQAAAGKTLIINGTGSLTASSYGWGAGIGGGSGSGAACGNIEIQGGTITATSVEYGAGIGGGNNSSWGNITISGGTVTATGGYRGAGIGGGRKSSIGSVSCGNIIISGGTVTAAGGEDAAGIGGGRGYNAGYLSSCGTITITTGVTKVTATMGSGATNSIGAGYLGTCGTVTIGGNEGAITTSPYTYQP